MNMPWMPDPRHVRQLRLLAQRPAQNEAHYESAFTPMKDRLEPRVGDRVRVYRNLNNGQYSVKALDGPFKGLVLGHAPAIGMTEIALQVSQKTRDKVVEKGVRNVHAWCEGLYLGSATEAPEEHTGANLRITYFPFVKSHFFLRTQPDKAVTALTCAWAFKADLWVTEIPNP